MELGARKILGFGDFFITETVIFAWIVSIALIAFAHFATRDMKTIPKGAQAVGELIVETVYNLVGQTMGKHNLNFSPYIGTLFLFLIFGNALGLLGIRPVTANVNTTFALAALTFVIIHGSAIRSQTLWGYIKHLSSPYPFMLSVNLIGELSFPVSLAFRLFGNITGGMIIMELLFESLTELSHGLHLPVPFLNLAIPLPFNLFFDVFEAGLQGFIFTMLTMVFISNGIIQHHGEH